MLIHSLQPPVQVAPVKSISKVVSPCIKICTLQDDFCIGCGRSTQEIAEWATAIWMPDVLLPELNTGELMTLTLSLLGLGGMRSFEKTKGVARENMKK